MKLSLNHPYESPKMETEELMVEQGFAISGNNPNDTANVDEVFDWIGDWQ